MSHVSDFEKPLTKKQAEAMWCILKNAFDQIHNHNAASLSYEQLYRCGYQLVVNKYGEYLYDNVQNTLKEHLRRLRCKLIQIHDSQFLSEILSVWHDYQITLRMIADVLMYLDRQYCIFREQKIALFIVGIEIFRQELLEFVPLAQRLLTQISLEIRNDRVHGGGMDRRLVKRVLSMLQYSDPNLSYYRSRKQTKELQDILKTSDAEAIICIGEFYRRLFEGRFLENSTAFYHDESYNVINEFTVLEFLDKAENRIDQEMKRADDVLPSATKGALLGRLIFVWIIEHAKTLVCNETQGCEIMFENDRIDELGKLFRLLCRAPDTLTEVQNVMEHCIVRDGERIIDEINSEIKTPITVIENLLELRHRYGRSVSLAFEGNPRFQRTMKISFEKFLNRDTKVARYLAIYLDSLVKQYQSTNTSEEFSVNVIPMKETSTTTSEIEKKVNDAILLFRCIEDKDIFESFYRDLLGKRLLGNRVIVQELERFVVTRLQMECGHAYTTKLDGMLRDVARSKELDQEFRREMGELSVLNVSVLTTSHWSLDMTVNIALPSDLTNLCEVYEQFYLKRHTGRRLKWIGTQGIGELRATFDSCKRDLIIGTVSMLILLLFNDRNRLTYDDIARELQVNPIDELKRHLISLYLNKNVRILLRCSHRNDGSNGSSPKASSWAFADDDCFEVNTSFSSRTMKVRVPAVKPKPGTSSIDEPSGVSESSSSTSSQAVPLAVESERRLQTDAAIVRIMKSRKKIRHNDLVVEVTRLLEDRFVPKPPMIKSRIANLIDRDFLERSLTEIDTYLYVA